MTKLLGLLAILILQLPVMAQASHQQFLDYLKTHASTTPANFEAREIYSYSRDFVEVDESLHEQLLSIAQSQSEVWVDTILEGDVASLGEIRLDEIEELKDGDSVLGYRITYSQQAWSTADCDLSEATSDELRNPEVFAQCAEGRIFESAYVIADLSTYFADYSALAELELND